MKAYLTQVRKIENSFHLLGIENPVNINLLEKFDLISGYPIICVIANNSINSIYLIDCNKNLNQIHGLQDDLFSMNVIYDKSLINLKKYNCIKYLLLKLFEKLSMKELNFYKKDLIELENIIFYNLLHNPININQIKNYLIKEFKKIKFSNNIKNNFLLWIKTIKMPSKRILDKKIDLNLSGYNIKISSSVN